MKLLQPYSLGPLTLPNRIVMAPMTRNRATETVPCSLMATYYRQRASAGLIITEATQVDPMGQGYPNTPGIHSQKQVEGWREITDAVHGADGRIFLQLWHVGRISHSSFHEGRRPVAPSAVRPRGETFTANGRMAPFETPRTLETEEIWDRQTETWWQQYSGEAIVGDLTGKQLQKIPSSILSWADFRKMYPEGSVLSRETGYARDYGENPYIGYDDVSNRPFMYDGPVDDRLRPMARVVGVTLEDAGRAYQLKDLQQQRAINDTLDGQAVVIV